jgi:hypothetical protein
MCLSLLGNTGRCSRRKTGDPVRGWRMPSPGSPASARAPTDIRTVGGWPLGGQGAAPPPVGPPRVGLEAGTPGRGGIGAGERLLALLLLLVPLPGRGRLMGRHAGRALRVLGLLGLAVLAFLGHRAPLQGGRCPLGFRARALVKPRHGRVRGSVMSTQPIPEPFPGPAIVPEPSPPDIPEPTPDPVPEPIPGPARIPEPLPPDPPLPTPDPGPERAASLSRLRPAPARRRASPSRGRGPSRPGSP